ncbi:hypothetical protein SRHO_G00189460 [Serrasalmus rhombeus]
MVDIQRKPSLQYAIDLRDCYEKQLIKHDINGSVLHPRPTLAKCEICVCDAIPTQPAALKGSKGARSRAFRRLQIFNKAYKAVGGFITSRVQKTPTALRKYQNTRSLRNTAENFRSSAQELLLLLSFFWMFPRSVSACRLKRSSAGERCSFEFSKRSKALTCYKDTPLSEGFKEKETWPDPMPVSVERQAAALSKLLMTPFSFLDPISLQLSRNEPAS